MKTAKEYEPNENAKAILAVLKANPEEELTLKAISDLVGFDVKPGMITPLVKNGYLDHGEDAEVEKVVKTKVKTYKLVD